MSNQKAACGFLIGLLWFVVYFYILLCYSSMCSNVDMVALMLSHIK